MPLAMTNYHINVSSLPSLAAQQAKQERKHPERALILIDGSNLYFKLRDLALHHLLSFDFSRFAHSLVGKRELVNTTYYVGKIRTDGTERTQQLFNNQRKLLAHLRKHHIR